MSRMSKRVGLVLISSSLILAGCPSPRRVEPQPRAIVPGPALDNDAEHKKDLAAILAANVVGSQGVNPLTTVVAGAAAVLVPDAHVPGVANQYVRPHAATRTHHRYYHYYSYHNYYSPFYYPYRTPYVSPSRTVSGPGSGFHAPRPTVISSGPSTSTSRPSSSVSSTPGGFGTKGHSVSS